MGVSSLSPCQESDVQIRMRHELRMHSRLAWKASKVILLAHSRSSSAYTFYALAGFGYATETNLRSPARFKKRLGGNRRRFGHRQHSSVEGSDAHRIHVESV